MIKVDLHSRESSFVTVAVCLPRQFFQSNLGMTPDELPRPLSSIARPDSTEFGFHRFPLTPDILAVARAALAAPPEVRRQPLYVQAKTTELVCLLVHALASRRSAVTSRVFARHESRLKDARNYLTKNYSEHVTLEGIAREVGLNKMALTAGFRQLFGVSVFDCLHRERMQRAYELLQDRAYTIAQVASAVGYEHSCNFSTAFNAHFGCTPKRARDNGARTPTG
jgi:AraC-like DNA-binding protein